MDEELFDNYWDWVSSQDINTEGKYSKKDVIKEAYDMALPLIQELMYVESDFIYLNLVCDVPQTTIAKLYGLSQLGVSKRVNGGFRKIQTIVDRPVTDMMTVQEDFKNLLPKRCREIAFLYYKNRLYQLVSKMIGESSTKVSKVIGDVKKILDDFVKSHGKENRRLREDLYIEYKERKEFCDNMKDADFRDRMVTKAERYLEYFNRISSEYNYGNLHFKARSRNFERRVDA